jgi:hypothetical protein
VPFDCFGFHGANVQKETLRKHHGKGSGSVNYRELMQGTIAGIRGGWTVAAAHIGMTLSALENRVYEKKGQQLSLRDTLALQYLAGNTMVVDWVCEQSGGTFVKLPDGDDLGNQELLTKFNELHGEIGRLSMEFNDATKDNVISSAEAERLRSVGAEISKTTQELLALTFKIFSK